MIIFWEGAQPAYRANMYLRWKIRKSASTAAQEDKAAILANNLLELDMFKLVEMNNIRHNRLWTTRGGLG